MSAIVTRFGDDMMPLEWLQEIGLAQYVECFKVNFTVGGSYLSRKLLATVRLQDFSKMNIQIFEHQKLLLRHIEHSLQYSFNDPNRRREISEEMQNDKERLIEWYNGQPREQLAAALLINDLQVVVKYSQIFATLIDVTFALTLLSWQSMWRILPLWAAIIMKRYLPLAWKSLLLPKIWAEWNNTDLPL